MYNNFPANANLETDPNIAGGTFSNQNFLTPEQINKLKGYAFWIKFIAILYFIGVVPTIILGIVLAIILIGIPILLVGIFMIYINLKLWRAAKALDFIIDNNNQQSFNSNGLEFMVNVGSYYKIIGILTILSWVGSIILIILSMIFGNLAENYLKDVNQSIQTNITSEAQK